MACVFHLNKLYRHKIMAKRNKGNTPHLIIVLVCSYLATVNLTVLAGPGNIASQAQISASAELNENYSANNIVDGQIRISGIGEWASDSKQNPWGGINYPWIQLNWDEKKHIDKIVFYDRPGLETHLAGGTLQFSDGSEMSVNLIPNDGRACVVQFPKKEIEWFRFVVTDGFGDYLGLSEIEVFPSTEGELEPVSLVDPYIETTRGRYFFFVTGSQPFGMISSAPLTRNKNQMGGGYNYNSTEILSFPQVYLSFFLEFAHRQTELYPVRRADTDGVAICSKP